MILKQILIFTLKYSFGKFPRRVVRSLGSIFGWLWIDVFRIRKSVLVSNLKLAFPEKSDQERWQIARSSVYHMGKNFLEFFMIPGLNQKWIDESVIFEGFEHVQRALQGGQGAYFLSLHLGNADIALSAMALRGLPVHLITKKFKNPLFNELWFSIRGFHGVKYIDAHNAKNAFDILKVLKSNGIAIFVLDQFMGRPYGIESQFFGIKTGTAYGLAVFYLKTKSPIILSYTFEGDDQRMHIVFDPALDLDHLCFGAKDESILRLTQYFNDKLELVIRQHPEQWMWVHRRWKEFE